MNTPSAMLLKAGARNKEKAPALRRGHQVARDFCLREIF
jgi:hypothetical protein